MRTITNEYQLGYAQGLQDENGVELDGKSKEYIAGYCQALRDMDALKGPADTDSFDY